MLLALLFALLSSGMAQTTNLRGWSGRKDLMRVFDEISATLVPEAGRS